MADDPQVRDLEPGEEIVDPGALPSVPADNSTPPPPPDVGALDDLRFGANPMQIARASLATNPKTKIKRYSSMLGQPESDFNVDGDGEIVRKLKPGELGPNNPLASGSGMYARVEPSFSGGEGALDQIGRGADWAASGAGPAIPATVGTAASLMAAPTLGGMALAGITGGAIAEGGREWLDQELAGEDHSLGNFDYGNIVGQGVLQGAAPFIGAGISRVASKVVPPILDAAVRTADALNPSAFGLPSVAPKATWMKQLTYDNPLDLTGPAWNALRSSVTPEAEATMGQLRQEAARNGVDLDLGQVTGNYAIMQRVRQMLTSPETANDAFQFHQNQQGRQIPAAFRQFVDDLFPQGAGIAPEDAIHMFREAGDDVVQKAIRQRNAEANINFGTALDRLPNDPTSGIPQRYWTPDLQEIFETDPGKAGVAWAQKINNAIVPSQRPALTVPTYDGNGNLQAAGDFAPDWRSLDYIRKGMKADIESHTDQFGNVDAYGRQAQKTYRSYVGQLTAVNPQYGTALGMYGDASDAMNMVLDGGPGVLQRMKGADRLSVLDRFFGGDAMMPNALSQMRDAFVNAGHEDEFNIAGSAWMRGKLADALTPRVGGGEPGNVAGKLFQQFSDDESGSSGRDMLVAATGADPAKIDRIDKFLTVLNASSKYLEEGSRTATDLEPAQSGAGRTTRGLMKLLDLSTYSHLGTTLGEGVANMFDRNARTRTLNYLLSPEGDDMLSQMAALKPSSVAARQLLGQFFVNAGVAKGAQLRNGLADRPRRVMQGPGMQGPGVRAPGVSPNP